jgi:superkiller protein 3
MADLDMLDRLAQVILDMAKVMPDPAKPADRPGPPSESSTVRYSAPGMAVGTADATPAYQQAFAEYGIPVLTLDPPDAARRISARAIRAELVSALDSWALLARDKAVKQQLLDVARLADADAGGMAAELREAMARRDPEALGQLLTASDRLRRLPAGTLAYVASSLIQRGDAAWAAELLQAVRERDPGDFWANYYLGFAYSMTRPPRPEDAVTFFTAAVALRGDGAPCHYNLGVALHRAGRPREAAAAFRKAGELQPDLAAAHHNLGVVLAGQGDRAGAERAFRAGIKARPDLVDSYYALGNLLAQNGPADEAERVLREATRLDPNHADAHNDLGNVLAAQKRLDDAIEEYKAARALAPDDAKVHKNLGKALGNRGRWGEGEKSLREAVRLAPNDPEMHNDLGFTLYSQERLDAAIACYRKALELAPDYALALVNLGNALDLQGHHDEAIEEYRKAIKSAPKFAKAHNGLGIALYRKNDLAGAIAAYRDAIRVQPDFAEGHYNLGDALCLQRDFTAGIAACEKAIEINPSYAEAHVAIGLAQLEQGHFAEGVTRLERGHDLLDRADPRRQQVRPWLDNGRDLARLAEKLPAVLKGEAQPASNVERVRLAMICVRHQQLPLTASRLYLEAFTAEPRLGDDMQSGARYLAASAAALAGTGPGKDAGRLPDKERHMWRVQARHWLRANLTWWAQALDKDRVGAGPVLRQVLGQWQADANLAGVRDREALDALPEDERRQWRGLWDDVAGLLAKAGQK